MITFCGTQLVKYKSDIKSDFVRYGRNKMLIFGNVVI